MSRRLFPRSPVDFKPAKSGDFEIRRQTLKGCAQVVGTRQALLRGISTRSVRLSRPLRLNLLLEGGSLWMSDSPEELSQISEAIETFEPHGDVLVGGLGLGLLATMLRDHPGVRSVTVVEKSGDVIKLCSPNGVRVIHADIEDFLTVSSMSFSCYMLDTWQGTGESTWWAEIFPLRRIIGRKWRRVPVWCWAEDIMLGQCIPAAMRQKGRYWHYRAIPKGASEETVRLFFDAVGLPAWERRFGSRVDAVLGRG